MKQAPPTRAPSAPRSRHAQKMDSWVDAGPGNKLTAAIPSSNSVDESQPRSVTQSLRKSAMWVGGPPKPTQPIRPHSRAIVSKLTGARVTSLALPLDGSVTCLNYEPHGATPKPA